MMLYSCRLDVLLTRDQMPPRLWRGRASKRTTSQPWPTQCAAAETPEMPAPMTAIRGPVKMGPLVVLTLACGGGAGEKR